MPRVDVNVGPPNLLDLLRILLGLRHRRLLLDLAAVVSGHLLSLRLLLILVVLLLGFYARLLNVLLVSLVLLSCWLFDPALHDLLLALQRGALLDWLLLLLRRTLFLLNMPHILCPTQRCTLLLIFQGQDRSWSFSSFPIIIRYDQILNLLVH